MPDTPSVVLLDPNNVSQKLVRGKTEKKHERRNSLRHGKTTNDSKSGDGGDGSSKGHKAGSGGGGGHQSKKGGSLKDKKKATMGCVLEE